MKIERMTIPEFHAAINAQGVDELDWAFICPICGKVQSARDLIRAGAATNMNEAEKFLAFSCVGRWLNAGSFTSGGDNSNGCDWTLGGFLSIHELQVIDLEGKKHPRFKVATRKQAQAHARTHARKGAAS